MSAQSNSCHYTIKYEHQNEGGGGAFLTFSENLDFFFIFA